MKKRKEVVGFHFQRIPLEEAKAMGIAGSGNYSDLKAKILNEIPTLGPTESFAFGLPKGEVPEEQRRGICMAINAACRKAKFPWRTTYSGVKQLFILIPLNGKHGSVNAPANGHTPKSKMDQLDETAIVELWNQGLGVRHIADQLNADLGHVKYVCYHQNPRKPRVTTNWNGKVPDEESLAKMRKMMESATRLFPVSQDQIKKGEGQGKAVRKAICKVGYDQNIAPRIIADFVGLEKGSVKFNAKQETKFAQEEIKALKNFYRR